MTRYDVLVVGAGPAGTSAAIRCSLSGLQVALIERAEFPRHQPGETLHPGIEPLLVQLGVWQEIERLGVVRHAGANVAWGKPPSFVPFGKDENGEWRGLQVLRSDFDMTLLTHARDVGVNVIQACSPTDVRFASERVSGLETDQGPIASRFVIDATGARRWLSAHLGLEMQHASPALYARYGYRRGDFAPARDAPCLVADNQGWTWTARVQDNTYQWTRLDFDGSHRQTDWCPPELFELSKVGCNLGADVTWRISKKLCGKGYFLIGDAAFVLDPASSHGVLKAIMSGVLAGECAKSILQSPSDEVKVLEGYQTWLSSWFWNDVQSLAQQYSFHPNPPRWIQRLCTVGFDSMAGEMSEAGSSLRLPNRYGDHQCL